MCSFCLNNGFRLPKINRDTRCWKQPPILSRDKILHDSWSISAALARGFSDRHFERGEGPGDEVACSVYARRRVAVTKAGTAKEKSPNLSFRCEKLG